jgi:hypothetical protein
MHEIVRDVQLSINRARPSPKVFDDTNVKNIERAQDSAKNLLGFTARVDYPN